MTAPLSDAPTTLVRDDGFHLAEMPAGALVIPGDTRTEALPDPGAAPIVIVTFASFSDGRGFTLARALRARGFTGRLRARGPLIADQYAMARRSGFDEVEIPAEIAQRQPQDHWLYRADWQAHDYRRRFGA